MKRVNILIAAAFIAFLSSFTTIDNDKKSFKAKVDTKDSKVEWVGEKVTGKHEGTINIANGQLEVKNKKIVSGSFEIDMNSINVTDLEGEYKQKLEGHLKSDDFFGVNNHSKAKFVITKAVSQGRDKYKVSGDLTIKGITNKIEFPATVKIEGERVTALAKITIDRTKFNIKYGSGSFFDNLGDKTIYDEFKLDVTLITE
ncbi:YceI family protein [Rapidithrix thailandica]|uniref:YceI family protein n=1 Tax=Rapidithrix thailandica TaxID=413964 RepID=A0AAW9S414_9BACT